MTNVVKIKRSRPKSRPLRWAEAAATAADALDKLRTAADDFVNAAGELREVQEEYESWKDALPDNLQSSALADKLEEVCGLDIEGAIDSLSSIADDAEKIISEAAEIDLPRGFGRD